MNINWIKVGANAGVAFFSTLGSLLTFDSLIGGQIPKEVIIPASVMVAGIQGFLSFFKEIKEESERNPKLNRFCPKRKGSSSLKVLEYLTIW